VVDVIEDIFDRHASMEDIDDFDDVLDDDAATMIR